MKNAADFLSEEDVRQIARLVETLDKSAFDFLQLELGGVKLTIGKGDAPPSSGVDSAAVAPPVIEPSSPRVDSAATLPAAASAALSDSSGPPAEKDAPAQDGTVEIVAPIMGRFYGKPSPGAPPFVSVGARVAEDSTLALIEVMKVFNAVRAGVIGVIAEICVPDEQFVEYGQVLFRVRPTK